MGFSDPPASPWKILILVISAPALQCAVTDTPASLDLPGNGRHPPAAGHAFEEECEGYQEHSEDG